MGIYTINTFGSCVVEEVIQYKGQLDGDQFERVMRYARSSIVSCMATRIQFDPSSIRGISRADREMVLNDLNKNFFTLLRSNPTDFFAMDLVEEVIHPLVLIDSAPRKRATFTKQMRDSGFLNGQRYSKLMSWEFKKKYPDIFSACYQQFFERLLTFYDAKRIFLLETYMTDRYMNKKGEIVSFAEAELAKREVGNDHLKKLYDMILQLAPGINFMRMPSGTISDENHPYSLSMVHYDTAYNVTIHQEILEVVRTDEAYVPLTVDAEAYNVLNEDNMRALEVCLADLESKRIKLPTEPKTVGAIVVNCNPFTLGHRYLIEYAAARVDALYVFVVEEDRSVFSFKDRLSLVKQGTSDLANVAVLPSGKLILSSLTFDAYFEKEKENKRTVDPTMDVTLFAEQIAPVLGITVRFAGAEPLCHITNQYNETMKRILPRFGVSFEEILRKEYGDEPISASRVRKLWDEGDLEAISRIVPESTLMYLKELRS